MGLGGLAMLGSAFMQLPAMFGSLAATQHAWDLANKWSAQTSPSKYQQSNWATGDYAGVPTKVNTGINNAYYSSYNPGGLNGPKPGYQKLFGDMAQASSAYNGYFKS